MPYRTLGNSLVALDRAGEYRGLLDEAARKYGEDDPQFLVYLCRERRLAGSAHDAVATCRRALSIKEDDWSRFELGISQWLAGDTEGALDSLKAVRSQWQVGPKIVLILQSEGRFDEIEEFLASIRKPIPGRLSGLDYWSGAASSYYDSMRRFGDALAAVAEARRSGQLTWEAWSVFLEAEWHRQLGALHKARELLNETEATAPFALRAYANAELARLSAAAGDLDAAVEFAERAFRKEEQIDPDELRPALLARLQYAAGRNKEALETAEAIRGWVGRRTHVVLYHKLQPAALGGSTDALSSPEYFVRRASRSARGEVDSDDWGEASAYRALGLARIGDAAEARRAIDWANRLEPERADIAYLTAAAHALLGDVDGALKWLQTAVGRGHQELWWARVDPDLDRLRADPRFRRILSDWDACLRALWH